MRGVLEQRSCSFCAGSRSFDGPFRPEREYVLDEDLECPSCSTTIDGYTLVELQSITARAIATAHA